MNRRHIPIGRILGIPLGLDYSWFLAYALVTWLLAARYYPVEYHGWLPVQYWSTAALTALFFFGSVLLHEVGHSVVALRYRIPVRSITLFIFGGIAQIGAEPPGAAAEFWIAIAGPAVSFALAGFFGLLRPLFGDGTPLLALATYLAQINAILALFNLIPGFPLDGGRVFRAVAWAVTGNFRRSTDIAARLGRGIAFLFIMVGVWQALSGNLINGLWIAFIGWFLDSAAAAQVQHLAIEGALAGHKASELMGRCYAVIPANATLDEVVHRYVLGDGLRSFAVDSNGAIVGFLTLKNIGASPPSAWPATTAAAAMTPASAAQGIRPETDLQVAIKEMERLGVDQVPVVSDGRFVGLLTREGITSYLLTLRELGV